MSHDLALPPGSFSQKGTSIEQGYFVLTMMPSLFCELDCPHCYLSKAERRDPTRLPDAALRKILENIDRYFDRQGIESKQIQAYQYGGEPTSMGVDAFTRMLDIIDDVFSPDKGYTVHHTILSSLVEVNLDAWYPLLRDRCGGLIQSSYDGRMRGGAYLRKWDAQMRRARDMGLELSTISVVNARILSDTPDATLDYLQDLGVKEASFLPFMLNDQNAGLKYDRLAPTMAKWSEFMIGLSEAWIGRRRAGERLPEIGQMRYILAQSQMSGKHSNIAGQTLFLLPNGDFALPDYRQGWQEYMHRFGNAIATDFSEILSGAPRRSYLRRQVMRNGNSDCIGCPHAGCCVMEFWKPNRPEDDCFGGRGYVEWLLAHREEIDALDAGKCQTYALY